VPGARSDFLARDAQRARAWPPAGVCLVGLVVTPARCSQADAARTALPPYAGAGRSTAHPGRYCWAGCSKIRSRPGTWTVMRDPEGNEFCVTSASAMTGWALTKQARVSVCSVSPPADGFTALGDSPTGLHECRRQAPFGRVFGRIMLKERRSLRGSQRPVLAIGGHWISSPRPSVFQVPACAWDPDFLLARAGDLAVHCGWCALR
jgi:hypothetical protein